MEYTVDFNLAPDGETLVNSLEILHELIGDPHWKEVIQYTHKELHKMRNLIVEQQLSLSEKEYEAFVAKFRTKDS